VANPSPFVPLAPAASPAPGAESFRMKILSQPAGGIAFQPLADLVGTCARAAAAGTTQPSVTLKHEGDRVSAIRIQCTCGQVIELACDYGA
jgi:hypothetical protein